MRIALLGVIASLALMLAVSLPALAQESAVITITMTGLHEISITLNRTEWSLGDVGLNTEHTTDPPIEWCTLTVGGTCNVRTYIVGEDAKWIDDPAGYSWALSDNGLNGEHVYVLWFRISGDTEPAGRGYVPITKTLGEFWPYEDRPSLAPGDTKRFGLRLLTPTYFVSGRRMQTRITISAVAA